MLGSYSTIRLNFHIHKRFLETSYTIVNSVVGKSSMSDEDICEKMYFKVASAK